MGVVGTQHVTEFDVAIRAYGFRRIRAWKRHGLEFHPIGYLRLGRSDGDRGLFEQSLEYQREAGFDSARILEPAEIRRQADWRFQVRPSNPAIGSVPGSQRIGSDASIVGRFWLY